MTHSRDPETDKIERVVNRIMQKSDTEALDTHRISTLEERQKEHEMRMRNAEESLSDGRKSIGVIEEKIGSMKETLEKVSGHLSKLNWILIAAIVTAVIAGVLKHGGSP